MKYKTSMKKEKILETIIDQFEEVKSKLEGEHTIRDFGEYIALSDLLRKIEIYEVEEK